MSEEVARKFSLWEKFVTMLLLVGLGYIVYLVLFGPPQSSPKATVRPTLTVSDVNALKNEARYSDPRLLASDPLEWEKDNVYIQGKALTVQQNNDYTWINVNALVSGDSSKSEAIVVRLKPPVPTLLSDECYRFFGIGAGTTTVIRTLTNVEGQNATISGYAHEPSLSGNYGGCEAP